MDRVGMREGGWGGREERRRGWEGGRRDTERGGRECKILTK